MPAKPKANSASVAGSGAAAPSSMIGGVAVVPNWITTSLAFWLYNLTRAMNLLGVLLCVRAYRSQAT